MTTLAPEAAEFLSTLVEQDAGDRSDLAGWNAGPTDASAMPVRRIQATFGAKTPTAQDPEALTGLTSERGEARLHATLSMATATRGRAATILAARPVSKERFRVLQAWEGTVLERREGAIRVRLTDKTNGGQEEEAELMLDEVSEQDRDLVKPGAVFYWSIGYHDSASGQRTRQSVIVFRRLPAWTEQELHAIRAKVRAQKTLFGWT